MFEMKLQDNDLEEEEKTGSLFTHLDPSLHCYIAIHYLIWFCYSASIFFWGTSFSKKLYLKNFQTITYFFSLFIPLFFQVLNRLQSKGGGLKLLAPPNNSTRATTAPHRTAYVLQQDNQPSWPLSQTKDISSSNSSSSVQHPQQIQLVAPHHHTAPTPPPTPATVYSPLEQQQMAPATNASLSSFLPSSNLFSSQTSLIADAPRNPNTSATSFVTINTAPIVTSAVSSSSLSSSLLSKNTNSSILFSSTVLPCGGAGNGSVQSNSPSSVVLPSSELFVSVAAASPVVSAATVFSSSINPSINPSSKTIARLSGQSQQQQLQPITLIHQDIPKLVSFNHFSSASQIASVSASNASTPQNSNSSTSNKNSALARLLQQANSSSNASEDWAEITGVSGTGGGRCRIVGNTPSSVSVASAVTSLPPPNGAPNVALYANATKSTSNISAANNLSRTRCGSPLVCLVLDD